MAQVQLAAQCVAASAPAPSFTPDAVVLGAGCCGLAVAIQLLEAGHRVALVSKDHTPRTTSDQAGALWRPFGEVSPANAAQFRAWGQETFRFLNAARLKHGSPATGILLVSGFEVFPSAQPRPFWADDVLNFRQLSAAELRELGIAGVRGEHTHGFSYTSIIIDMDVYMRFLHREFTRLGGVLRVAEVASLADGAAEVKRLYPTARLVVNCTGLGAAALVPDASVFPVAGHIVKVSLPGLHHFFMDSTNTTYVFPRAHDAIVGGTYFKHDGNTRPSIANRDDILRRAAAFVPELSDVANVRIVGEYVGLRPYRDVTRLELDAGKTIAGGMPVIHNYGHGGSGVTLHWGCASSVLDIAAKLLPPPQKRSKL